MGRPQGGASDRCEFGGDFAAVVEAALEGAPNSQAQQAGCAGQGVDWRVAQQLARIAPEGADVQGEFVRIAGRGDEHESAHFGREGGKVEVRAQGQAAAERIAQEDCVVQAEGGDKGREVAGLHVRRVALVCWVGGKTRLATAPVADQVGGDNAAAGQAAGQAEPRSLVVKDAVQQHQRGMGTSAAIVDIRHFDLVGES